MEHELTAAVLGVSGLLLGLLMIAIGAAFHRSHRSPTEMFPVVAFSFWWYTAGGFVVLTGTAETLDVLWRPDFALHVTVIQMRILLGVVALFSLSHYFTYLYTGSHRFWIPLAIFYGLSWGVLTYLINWQRPIGLDIQQGQIWLVYAEELPLFGLVLRLVTLLFVPPMLGLIGYILLYKRVSSPLQKFRIVTIVVLILSLFIKTVMTQVLLLEIQSILRIGLRLVGLSASGLLLMSYYPPAAFYRRMEARTW